MKLSTIANQIIATAAVILALVPANAQVDLASEITSSLESIASIASSHEERVTGLLSETGFVVPENMKSTWNNFPAYRKIETAYLSASAISKPNGEKFLAMMSQNLAQQYEAVHYQASLKSFLSMPRIDHVSYAPFQLYSSLTAFEPHISEALVTITKYSGSNSFSTINILKKNFGLADDVVYNILRRSSTNFDALSRGAALAKAPPYVEQRLKKIVNELSRVYEGARYERAFQNLKRGKSIVTTEGKVRQTITARAKKTYNTFNSINYGTKGAAAFKRMRVNVRGFGGLIFGNDVTIDVEQKLVSSLWVPDLENNKVGTLEFIFDDGTMSEIPQVPYEDLVAAKEIVSGTDIEHPFVEGDGVGLVGIYDRVDDEYVNTMDSSAILKSRFRAVVHPALQNRSLGLSAIACDALPILKDYMWETLAAEYSDEDLLPFEYFMREEFSTWKITEAPLTVFRNGDLISFRRTDCLEGADCDNSHLMMTGFVPSPTEENPDSVTAVESPGFYYSLPLITANFPEYDHLNNFATILAAVRWIHHTGLELELPALQGTSKDFLPILIVDHQSNKLTIPNPAELSAFWRAYRGHCSEKQSDPELGNLLQEVIRLRSIQWNAVLTGDPDDDACDAETELAGSVNAYSSNLLGWNLIDDTKSLEEQRESIFSAYQADFMSGEVDLQTKYSAAFLLTNLSEESTDLDLVGGGQCEDADNNWLGYALIIGGAVLLVAVFRALRKRPRAQTA